MKLLLLRPAHVIAALLLAVGIGPASSDESGVLALLPAAVVSPHSISVEDHTLNYAAEAGTLPLRDEKGAINAKIFYVAYSVANTGIKRPITFVFNGGPGAA